MIEILLSGLVVVITHTLEAVTGFGCSVLAMPFITALLGMKVGVMVLTVLAWLLALYFVITKWKDIVWKQCAIIIGCMLIGLPVGMYLFRTVDGEFMKIVLAIFISVVSAWQLLKKTVLETRIAQTETPTGWKAFPYYLFLIGGGIIHGMFSTGGPLVVLYASKALKDKGQFRATLCVVWTVMNSIIISSYFIERSFTLPVAKTTGWLVPFVIAGIIIGEKIHGKVNERTFSIIVFSMLLLTGVVMLVQ